eukprot:5413390-Pleurochrysis_carterae.AAC.1
MPAKSKLVEIDLRMRLRVSSDFSMVELRCWGSSTFLVEPSALTPTRRFAFLPPSAAVLCGQPQKETAEWAGDAGQTEATGGNIVPIWPSEKKLAK